MSSSSSSIASSSSSKNQDRYRMMLAVCRYEYCLYHKLESKPTRSQFRSLMQEKGIHLPFDEFKKGNFIKFNGSEFFVDKERKNELNSTFLSYSNENQSLDLSIKKELISIELDNPQKTQVTTIELIELESLNSAIFSQDESAIAVPMPASAEMPAPTEMPASAEMPAKKRRCLGLDKTVDQDQIYWHVDKISGQRIKHNKRQYKVNWSEYNGKKFRPSWTNESLLNCNDLIIEFDPKAKPKQFCPAEDDLEITRSEVIYKQKKYKTNHRHLKKRNV